MEYGLIGKKLGHSYSPDIHSQIGDYKYELQEIPPENLDDFMVKREFKGINVTIPYKQDVIKHLFYISDEAKEIGAVNTIVNKDGKLYGYNTDCLGLTALINHAEISLEGKKVLILGTGGTSKTATYVAGKLGAKEIIHVSRHSSETAVSYEEALTNHKDAGIIINTTPSGMFPDILSKPIDISAFENLSGIVDAIYNPFSTKLVRDGLNKGIKATGGFYMLVAQAVYAASFFLDKEIETAIVDKIYNNLISKKKNIVLIGMPSCGKTAVGRKLAEKTGKQQIDIDKEIVKEINMEISEYFAQNGEPAFRKVEHEMVEKVSAYNTSIISTGGGCVLNPENINLLKMNGTVVFINRGIEHLLCTKDRPLSSSKEAVQKLFETRYPLYKKSCDIEVDGNVPVEDVANTILEML